MYLVHPGDFVHTYSPGLICCLVKRIEKKRDLERDSKIQTFKLKRNKKKKNRAKRGVETPIHSGYHAGGCDSKRAIQKKKRNRKRKRKRKRKEHATGLKAPAP